MKPRTPADTTPGGGGTAQRATPADAGLRVDAVCRYGVGPVSFTAPAGTFVVVTGGDRTGKSTVVGVVAGFDRPDAGRVWLDGDDVHAMSRSRLESRVGWLGAVVPHQGRSQRLIPPLVVADDPEAPFVVELEQAANVIVAIREQQRLDRRLTPLVRTVRHMCDQGAVVVIGTRHDVLVRAADRVVRL